MTWWIIPPAAGHKEGDRGPANVTFLVEPKSRYPAKPA